MAIPRLRKSDLQSALEISERVRVRVPGPSCESLICRQSTNIMPPASTMDMTQHRENPPRVLPCGRWRPPNAPGQEFCWIRSVTLPLRNRRFADPALLIATAAPQGDELLGGTGERFAQPVRCREGRGLRAPAAGPGPGGRHRFTGAAGHGRNRRAPTLRILSLIQFPLFSTSCSIPRRFFSSTPWAKGAAICGRFRRIAWTPLLFPPALASRRRS